MARERRSIRDRVAKSGAVDTGPKKSTGSNKFLKYIDYKKSGLEKFKFKPTGTDPYVANFLPFPATSKLHPQYTELMKQAKADGYDDALATSVKLYTHKITNGKETHTILCPKESYGKECPICDKKWQLFDEYGSWASMTKEEQDEIKACNTSERDLYAIQNTDSGTVAIMDYSTFLFGEKLEKKLERVNSTGTKVILADPEAGGHSLQFFIEPNGEKYKDKEGNLTAGKIEDIEFIPRPDAIPDEVLDAVPDISAGLVLYSFDEIVSFMDGTYFAEEGDEDEEVDEEVDAPVDTPKAESKPKAEPEMSEREKRKAERAAKKAAEEAKEELTCPEGLEFGTDLDSVDECETCVLLEACEKAYESK